MEYFVTIIKDVGFPIFVAIFVLLRVEPAIRRLGEAISGMMVMIAKLNGMREEDVEEIVKEVMKRSRGRRRT